MLSLLTLSFAIALQPTHTNAIALPEMPTAYLCAADIEPKDW